MEKKYHTFGTPPKSNGKIVERGKIETSITHINDARSHVLVHALQ